MHTGDLLVELLQHYGVTSVFGVPGGQTCALYDAIARHPNQIQHLLFRDERNALFAADGFARMTGSVGVCDVTVGPGTLKLPSGLAEACHSSVPILCIISEVPNHWKHLYSRGTASQAMQQERLLDGLCCYSTTVQDPAQLPDILRIALSHATANRPAPAAILIPHNIFDEPWDPEQLPIPQQSIQPAVYPSFRCRPCQADVQSALSLLQESQRPVLLAGGGALSSGAFHEIIALAERLQIPILSTFSGRGIVTDQHDLSLGLVGNVGLKSTRDCLEQADTVFLIGYKSAQNSTFDWTLPRSDQKIIHLDIDAAELGKVFKTDIGLLGDAKSGLQMMLDQLEDGSASPPSVSGSRTEWIQTLKTRTEKERHQLADRNQSPLLPQRVMSELTQQTHKDDVVVCDASYVSGWGAIYYTVRKAGRVILTPRGSAGLGFALPAAIGASIARPDQRIIVLAGDGGLSYSLGELATIVRYGLNIKILVFNNHSLAWMEHWHRLKFSEGDGTPFHLNAVDFCQVARGFGCPAATVEGHEQLAERLKDCLETIGPALLDIQTSRDASPLPYYVDSIGLSLS